jgi:hypothetical protein
MITRPSFGLNYQGYDRRKAPPDGFITESHNKSPRNHVIRGGFQALSPGRQMKMMDPLDPSTWQRPYEFTT